MAYRRFKLPSRDSTPATLANLATVAPEKPRSVANVASVAGGAPSDLSIESPFRWWHDPEEVLARFDESAGIREFDLGLSRHEAELVAAECVVTELQLMGLTAEEAEATLTAARHRHRLARH